MYNKRAIQRIQDIASALKKQTRLNDPPPNYSKERGLNKIT